MYNDRVSTRSFYKRLTDLFTSDEFKVLVDESDTLELLIEYGKLEVTRTDFYPIFMDIEYSNNN